MLVLLVSCALARVAVPDLSDRPDMAFPPPPFKLGKARFDVNVNVI